MSHACLQATEVASYAPMLWRQHCVKERNIFYYKVGKLGDKNDRRVWIDS